MRIYLILLVCVLKTITSTAQTKIKHTTLLIKSSDSLSSAYKLYEIFRPAFFTAENGEQIKQPAFGTGLLDKDSLPVGEWKFYSKPTGGKLLYKGYYRKTRTKDFVIHDPENIGKTDTVSLKKQLAIDFPVLKTGMWKYYLGNRIIERRFPSKNLPVIISATEDGDIIRYAMLAPEQKDEWIMRKEFENR